MADEVAPKFTIRRLPTRPGRVRVRRVRAEVTVRRRRRFAPAATFFPRRRRRTVLVALRSSPRLFRGSSEVRDETLGVQHVEEVRRVSVARRRVRKRGGVKARGGVAAVRELLLLIITRSISSRPSHSRNASRFERSMTHALSASKRLATISSSPSSDGSLLLYGATAFRSASTPPSSPSRARFASFD